MVWINKMCYFTTKKIISSCITSKE
ncbi:hypothetical protein BDFB_015254 [Asbolus verrucosus]|uniref:Uncharacterized protein n=1 Tax=Asbolus verrucosus TaxID=1661398 RepID=A0A482W472_ASBVE|nr:hypothetical protein BDFB_015254 [Asbolus verrucosus]